MSLRLLCLPWTKTALGSSGPQINVNHDTEHLGNIPAPSEAQQLLNQMKKEAITRTFLNSCASVSVKVDDETIEKG